MIPQRPSRFPGLLAFCAVALAAGALLASMHNAEEMRQTREAMREFELAKREYEQVKNLRAQAAEESAIRLLTEECTMRRCYVFIVEK